MTSFARFLTSTVVCTLLSACVVVPRTQFAYDETCKVLHREMVLDVQEVAGLRFCSGRGEDCAAQLVALGVVAAASAVVSGSIVVIGNVVYWMERQGQRCLK